MLEVSWLDLYTIAHFCDQGWVFVHNPFLEALYDLGSLGLVFSTFRKLADAKFFDKAPLLGVSIDILLLEIELLHHAVVDLPRIHQLTSAPEH